MIAFTLALFSVALLELGTSPIVEEGHTHEWVELHIDEEVFSVFDANWTKTIERDGKEFSLLLVRYEVNDSEGVERLEFVMVVDCASNQLGVKSVYMHELANGLVLDVDVALAEMSLASKPLTEEDAAYFEVACSSKESK